MEMESTIAEIVRRGYSDPRIVECYAKATGVWPEEKFVFDKFFKKVGRVLDIGCGGGRTSFYLVSLGNKVTAIDLSPTLIKAAKERLSREPADIEFLVKNAQKLDYPDDHFNGAVFSFNGIGFIPRREGKLRFLKEIRRILKPGGRFFFTAHNLWSISRYLPLNIFKVAKISSAKLLHMNIREKELGEKYDDRLGSEAPYLDIKTRRIWDKIIKGSGFKIIYFNSRHGIMDKRSYSRLKDSFCGENYLFFVLEK